MLRIQLLGDLRVLDGETAVALPQSRKTRALLGYLAATAKPQRRERLCELLWNVPDDPRGALRWSLSKLRGVLDRPDAAVVAADRQAVSLKLSPEQVDLLAVRAALRDGVGAVSAGVLEQLAGTFRGPLLADLDLAQNPELQSWLIATREEARQLHIAILAALDERHAAEPAHALPFARELVQLDPDSEGAWARLVERLEALGRHREAEEQREAAKKALADVGGGEALRKASTRPAAAVETTAVPRQDVRFCRTADGTRIAYALAGEGPPLVKTANWMNHLEYDWESPIFGHFLRGLADGHRLLRYDARGNGLSDWEVGEIDLEAWLSDFEAVVDAAGYDRFPLVGMSQGASIAIAYAARHPERVSHLVLLGGFSAGAYKATDNKAFHDQRRAMTTLIRTGWGQRNPAFRQMFASLFVPSATPELAEAFGEQQRRTTSPDCAARYHEASANLDVRPFLSQVRAPTLIMHARHDAMVPIVAGRNLAADIPGAHFIELPTDNHMLLEGEPATIRFFEELRRFIA